MLKLKYVILFTLVLSGCGKDNTASQTLQNTAQTTTQVKANTITPEKRGRIMFKRCQACHTLEEGGKHKVGPNLWGIYNSKAGSKAGYAYSQAFLASDITWTNETMDAFIQKPRELISGNKMSFVGIKKQSDRDALQLYLRSQTTPTLATSKE